MTVPFSQALFDDRTGTQLALRRRRYGQPKDALPTLGQLDDGLAAAPSASPALHINPVVWFVCPTCFAPFRAQ